MVETTCSPDWSYRKVRLPASGSSRWYRGNIKASLLYLNTAPAAQANFFNLTLPLSVSIKDTGGFSQLAVFRLSFEAGPAPEAPPDGLFKGQNLGRISSTLQTVIGGWPTQIMGSAFSPSFSGTGTGFIGRTVLDDGRFRLKISVRLDLESEVVEEPDSEKMMEYRARLDQIEAAINRIRVPLSFFGEVSKLKDHVDLVRGKLARLNHSARESNPLSKLENQNAS
jgi:hypothetical protein